MRLGLGLRLNESVYGIGADPQGPHGTFLTPSCRARGHRENPARLSLQSYVPQRLRQPARRGSDRQPIGPTQ